MAAAASMTVTSSERARAEAELRRMRGALAGWLRYRTLNDEVATGARPAKLPAQVAAVYVQTGRDAALERRMALRLHALLSEAMDAQQLPDPNRDGAAVALARIAVAGAVPSETAAPAAQGFIWLWPIAIVVGAVLFTLVAKIRSDADVLKERERIECIKVGACTDYGFWLKVGGIALVSYLAWEKFGLKEAVAGWRRR